MSDKLTEYTLIKGWGGRELSVGDWFATLANAGYIICINNQGYNHYMISRLGYEGLKNKQLTKEEMDFLKIIVKWANNQPGSYNASIKSKFVLYLFVFWIIITIFTILSPLIFITLPILIIFIIYLFK